MTLYRWGCLVAGFLVGLGASAVLGAVLAVFPWLAPVVEVAFVLVPIFYAYRLGRIRGRLDARRRSPEWSDRW